MASTDSSQVLGRLVDNALDFLERSVGETGQNPKYAVIHFYSAVELFLKARLVAEHWSLAVTRKQEPDWEKFVAGDFQSVSLEESNSRLRKALRDGLSAQEMEAFTKLRNHRNKLVHFFHPSNDADDAKKMIQSVAKQQLIGWYYLHRTLTTKWSKAFEPWRRQIHAADQLMRRHHEFLRVIFEQSDDELKELETQGFILVDCPSCGFRSLRTQSDQKLPFDSDCLVCRLSENTVNIECPDCAHQVVFMGDGVATCGDCRKHFDPDDLAGAMIDEAEAHMAMKDCGEYPYPANCSDCEGWHTVVPLGDEQFFCASCFGEISRLEACEWCGELNTGDMEYSFVSGCGNCDGRGGWDDD